MKTELIKKLYDLARPFGRRKLAFVFGVVFLQGASQVVGVTSIFPFLALASDPARARESPIAKTVLNSLPELSDKMLLFWAGGFAITMLILANGLLLIGEIVRARYAEGLGHWLRSRLLSQIASNPYEYFLQRNTGELLKKTATDVQDMIRGVLLPALDGLSRFLTVTLLLITLVIIDPLVALIAGLGLGGFYSLVFGLLKHRRVHHSISMKNANRGAMREAQQLLGGIKPIKIHQCEKEFVARYERHSFEQAKLRKWMPVFQNTPRYLVEPLAFGGMIALVILLAARGDSFSTFLPKLGVMALAGYRLLPNLQLLYSAVSGISLYRHTVEEVHDEFTSSKHIGHRRKALKQTALNWSNSIKVKNLRFGYPNSAGPIFNDLNLEIKKNQFVALVGTTGSGKSTLVDLLLGLHQPESGSIHIDDDALTLDKYEAWRASIGYVPQSIFLLDDTIASNIAFGVESSQIDHSRVSEASRIAQISDFIENHLPDSYNTHVGERGVRLSGGQRQRIGLARALYHNPSTLVLDEATSALDDATEAAIMLAIEKLQGKTTLIVIAHRLSTIEQADKVFVLDKGHIIATGSFREVESTIKAPLALSPKNAS